MRNGAEPEAWTPEQTGACDGDLGSLVRNGEWGTSRLPAHPGKKWRGAALPHAAWRAVLLRSYRAI